VIQEKKDPPRRACFTEKGKQTGPSRPRRSVKKGKETVDYEEGEGLSEPKKRGGVKRLREKKKRGGMLSLTIVATGETQKEKKKLLPWNHSVHTYGDRFQGH